MLELMFGFVAAAAAFVLGYTRSRRFVVERLRYVDAVQHPLAPLVAATAAALLGSVAVSLLPIVGVGTALAFGISVGLGVAAARHELRRALPPAA
jgi:protein-S-isoprenylcysteine O-methyltransferase Ste14